MTTPTTNRSTDVAFNLGVAATAVCGMAVFGPILLIPAIFGVRAACESSKK